jgi:fermentation-respiration switch protein FrsA (DUF1100 family)
LSWFNKGFYLGRKGMEVRRISAGRQALRIAASSLAVFLLLWLTAYTFRDRLIFHPVRGLEMTIEKTQWPFEEVWLETSRGRINGWYLPGPPGHYTALLLHGNGGNLTNMIGRMMSYHRLQMGVLAIDYNGFGLSEGTPTLEGAVEGAVAAWDFLVETKGLYPRMIVVHGFSLGGGVAGQLLAQRPEPHPIVMEATFTSLTEEARIAAYPLTPLADLLLGGTYDTRKVLAGYRATAAIFMHSPDDEVVPYGLGRALFISYYGPKRWEILTGQHNDFPPNMGFLEIALAEELKLTFEPPAES